MSLFSAELLDRAARILDQCRAQHLTLTTAESCTGGLISALFTDIAGSSDVLTFGFTPYANAAKTALLGVPSELIERYGAVSEEVARAMAEGAIAKSHASLSIAVTGIAGPGGGTETKPVGLVHFASTHLHTGTRATQAIFKGNRSEIRLQAVAAALELLQQQLAA